MFNRRDLNTKPVKLQHRHFVLIAAIIRDIADYQERRHVANLFAFKLQRTNPGFDPDRFIAACFAKEEPK